MIKPVVNAADDQGVMIVSRHILNMGSVDAATRLLIVDVLKTYAAPAVGRAAITTVAKDFMTAFPDMVVTMEKLIRKPQAVEFHWTLTGTNSGTGVRVRINGYEEWQIDAGGLVAESKGHFDAAEYEPAHTAEQIVTWYSVRYWTLWVLLIGLPFAALLTGCVTLLQNAHNGTELRQAARQPSAAIGTHLLMRIIAVATLAAGLILVVVALHMLAD